MVGLIDVYLVTLCPGADELVPATCSVVVMYSDLPCCDVPRFALPWLLRASVAAPCGPGVEAASFLAPASASSSSSMPATASISLASFFAAPFSASAPSSAPGALLALFAIAVGGEDANAVGLKSAKLPMGENMLKAEVTGKGVDEAIACPGPLEELDVRFGMGLMSADLCTCERTGVEPAGAAALPAGRT